MMARTTSHLRANAPQRSDQTDRLRVLTETITQLSERVELLEERGRMLEAQLRTR